MKIEFNPANCGECFFRTKDDVCYIEGKSIWSVYECGKSAIGGMPDRSGPVLPRDFDSVTATPAEREGRWVKVVGEPFDTTRARITRPYDRRFSLSDLKPHLPRIYRPV